LSIRLLASFEDSEPKDSSLIAPALGREKRRSDRPDLFTAELAAYNATINYDFDFGTFTSSSTYSDFDQLFVVDLAGTFNQAIAFALDAYAYDTIFVEEARLASNPGGQFDWVIGGFYYYKRRDVDFNYRSSPAFLASRGITGLADEYYQRFGNHTNSNELAGFGELTYRFTDQVWLTGGLRYGSVDVQTITEPGGFNSNYLARALGGLSGPLTITPIPAGVGAKAKGSKASYKISLSYKPSDDLTSYATLSTGFRTPIVNARAGAVSLVNPADIVIPNGAGSDNLKNYEIGAKGTFLDGKLTANLAAYIIDWKNIQVQANRVSDSVQFATNIGAARSKGVEFEIAAMPTPNLTINLNGSVNDAKVTKLSASEAAISGAVLGGRLASPHFQGAATLKYTFDIGSDTEGFATATISHVGSFPGLFPNVPGNPNARQATYAFTDAFENVGLTAGAAWGEWKVTGYVENLFDNHEITYVHPEAFLASRFGTLIPRTVGVRFGYSM
ncbi:MAG: TonB-dependent receptor, partial [Rhodospirillaceae bacterium]|nr:TonB-dependent receptor [Rhodospirillaceae bacterium]